MPTTNASALDGLRVVDFGQYLAGPLVALMLAENGADVVRVDPPDGPMWDHPCNAMLQRSKRSVVLDLHDAKDVAVASEIIANADVVVEGFRPGVMARLGLSPQTAIQRDARLIWCSIPGFGRDDPRADLQAWEGVVSSAAGLYPPGLFAIHGEPRFSAVPIASTFAALIAAHSVAAAILGREVTGRGDLIEVPLFDAGFDAIAIYGEAPGTLSQAGFSHVQNRIANPAFGTESPYRCRDGRYLGNCGSPPGGLHRFWDDHLPVELKSRTDPAGVEQARKILSALFAERDAVEWERVLQEKYGAAVASSMTSAEWLADEHALSSGSVVRVDDPLLGATSQPGAALKYADSIPTARFPRRVVGEDTDAVKAELKLLHDKPEPGADGERSSVLPLSGVRILDLTNLLAGPIGGRILAEYGADVIKINKAAIGFDASDPMTDDPITFIGHRTTGAGKRTMYLDLKSDEGQQILADLVGTADVVHTNMPPDTAHRLGLDEAAIRAMKPDIVYSSTRLHASGGWRGAYRGHEDLAEHVTGMSTRYGGGTPDGMHGIIVNDHATGHLAAFGVILALIARGRTGVGERVETSLSQTATYFQIPYMIDYPGARWDEPSGTGAMGWDAANRLYKASDAWLYVASVGPGGLDRLLEVLGLAERAEASLESLFASGEAAEWVRRLREAGIPAHRFDTIASLMTDETARSRGLSITREHPGLGVGTEVGSITRFASRPDMRLAPATVPGWHTREILGEIGHGHDFEGLLQRRVVATDQSRSAGQLLLRTEVSSSAGARRGRIP